MRRLVAYEHVSLDGVAQDPDEFALDWDDVMEANLAAVIAPQTTVLLGRRMYDEWSRYWPESDMQPFADFINAVDKRVATSSPLTHPWTNATAIEGDVLDAVHELRAADGGEIGLHGSLELTSSLITAGLVDDLRLVVAPRVAGSGRRLFGDQAPPRSYDLVSSRPTPTGTVLLHYRASARPA